MLKKLLFLLIMLVAVNSYGQKVHSIRFVHIGIEEKPIGTLVICVEKLIHPRDKPSDDIFGRGIITDIRTFETIRKYTLNRKYLISGKSPNINYRIVINDKQRVYLDYKNSEKFFRELRALLIKEKCDMAIVQQIKNKPW